MRLTGNLGEVVRVVMAVQRGQLRRSRILNFTKTSFDPRGTLRARGNTTNNKNFNRAPRGIRSRTHTVYHMHADVDKGNIYIRVWQGVLIVS